MSNEVNINPSENNPVSTQQTSEPTYAGRYTSVDGLETGYKELQGEYTRVTQELAALRAQQTPTQAQPQPAPQNPQAAQHGDLGQYYSEYAQTGTLSVQSIDNLSKSTGLPHEIVMQHMAGMQALATQTLNSGYERVGGQDEYEQITAWAAANVPQDVAIANQYLQEGNTDAWLIALDSLRARYEQNYGVDPENTMTGNNSPNIRGRAKGFNSSEEMVRAMEVKDQDGSNRYQNDPEYRAEVARRVEASNLRDIQFEGNAVGRNPHSGRLG